VTTAHRPLTRAAFIKTLDSSATAAAAKTVFDVKGLAKLKDTFALMDRNGPELTDPIKHAQACRHVLLHAAADIDEDLLPGTRDVSDLLSDPKEVFGPSFEKPTSITQQIMLRKDRNQFTAAEDNLVLRGVVSHKLLFCWRCC
jgi:hypothetical protein